jgi:DNA-binding NarL/FixJ family response regulator
MKKVLVIDDQFGKIEDPMYEERYGNGQVPDYSFVLEESRTGSRTQEMFGIKRRVAIYGASKAIQRVNKEMPNAIILDMDFGLQQAYGYIILQKLQMRFPEIPVLISTSTDDEGLVKKCLDAGAKKFIGKLPNPEMMKQYLDSYTS